MNIHDVWFIHKHDVTMTLYTVQQS